MRHMQEMFKFHMIVLPNMSLIRDRDEDQSGLKVNSSPSDDDDDLVIAQSISWSVLKSFGNL